MCSSVTRTSGVDGMSFSTVAVLGLGKVGLLAATFLDEAGFERLLAEGPAAVSG